MDVGPYLILPSTSRLPPFTGHHIAFLHLHLHLNLILMLPIFLILALSFPAFAAELESVSSIPSSTLDSLGETAGGYGSAAAYDRKAGILYLTTDRGPGDGKIDFSPRLYAVQISSPAAMERGPTENSKSNAQASVGTRSLGLEALAKGAAASAALTERGPTEP